ncbi:molybdopterin converting factor subunit 1 [Stutzerimonas stutzeri]|uniref:molybdopterin converting factor subunit 1 n=1 Tax=Stutzerimonas sp. S1 TaxID=3030652 RepID=UPI002224969B|nr:molybdopterin converting factor subunit 1 [Stutzerimonas sp. S1]MCW3147160.1 molybdopterin converting factor subunit 1 [Stutzerimonas sp. S1]
MLRINYFARYRELLGCEFERLPWQAEFATIEQLRQFLQQRGGHWALLAERNLMCARNQELCNTAEPLQDGDEIAFFPPVTGG